MKISKERFEELVSLYLDSEATDDELDLLADCISSDEAMRKIFITACRVHIATCRLYGKECKLENLRGIQIGNITPKQYSRKRAYLEWLGVLCLMLISTCLLLYIVETTPNKEEHPRQIQSSKSNANFEISISETLQYSPDNDYYGIISITQKKQEYLKKQSNIEKNR